MSLLGIDDEHEPRFEELPVVPAGKSLTVAGPLLHDAETYLLSSLMQWPEEMARAAHLPPEAFGSDEPRKLWTALRSGLEWPMDLFRIEKDTGIPRGRLFEYNHAISTSAGLDGFIGNVEDGWRSRRFKRLVSEMVHTDNPDPQFWAERLADLTDKAPSSDAESFGAYEIPPDGDTSVLLGDRYLNRGDGLVFSGPSGMGKSSQIRQMMTCWALARDFHGIKPNGPMRSLEIQAEDTRGDVAESRVSLEHCMNLTDEEKRIVRERVLIKTERVRRGPEFVAELRKLVAKHKPDLVWINPLQAFMDGDVTESKDLGDFLRAGLNSLNEPATFGYVIVHHTTKPPQDKADRSWSEEQYNMAGGADLINWARAIISLKAGAEPGEFNLVLAKRGVRAGVTKPTSEGSMIHETVTTIPLKWSKDEIELPGRKKRLKALFWEGRSPDVAISKGPGGRPANHSLQTYLPIFPSSKEDARGINQLLREAKQIRPLGVSSFVRIIDEALEDGVIQVDTTDPKRPRYWVKK